MITRHPAAFSLWDAVQRLCNAFILLGFTLPFKGRLRIGSALLALVAASTPLRRDDSNLPTFAEPNIFDFEILSGCLVNTKGGLAAKWAILRERSRPQALPYRQFGTRTGSLSSLKLDRFSDSHRSGGRLVDGEQTNDQEIHRGIAAQAMLDPYSLLAPLHIAGLK